MQLVYKQLFRQIIKDRIFLSLLLLLSAMPSLFFFFGMFSIDGNMAMLNALDRLSENQQLYINALNSNTILTYRFLVSLTSLSALVFVMFFYRFFRASQKQLGCLKALGYKDCFLQIFFAAFTGILAIFGALLGLLGGFFLSDILINANTHTYAVTGLIKSVGSFSLIIGLAAPTTVFCITALLCYGFVRKKEAGLLLSGSLGQNRFSATLKIADRICRLVPENQRLSLRIALRKPLSVLLLFTAVMSFCVCIILGQSLHISSAKVYDAQTTGHNYEYDIQYLNYQTKRAPNNAMVYLNSPASFSIGNYKLDRTITGFYHPGRLYELKNQKQELLAIPKADTVYINSEFSEIYGVKVGDTLAADISGVPCTFTVKDIAVNAKAETIYMNGPQLAEIRGVAPGSYNGILSPDKLAGDTITSKARRLDDLSRNAVSNKVSGVINQAAGVLAGALLIFLALYINFQDNTHDIVILHMLGHPIKYIRRLLVNVYLPILWTAFAVTLAPSILLAKTIQKSLSISTNDYMPFGINMPVILIAFTVINFIYWNVQITFSIGIKKTLDKKEVTQIIYGE